MKRAARFKTGSVVFDKRRKTWNFLHYEDGKRRTRVIGSLQQFPTKGAAWREAQSFQLSSDEPKGNRLGAVPVSKLVEGYRTERMPKRGDTRRSYEVWISNHILPKWGDCLLSDLEPRPVELWLESLPLSPKSKTHIRGVLRNLWDFAAWSGDAPREQRNPMELVRIRGASKRIRTPRNLTVEEFRQFVQHLPEPYRTMALLCCCLGLRISECLALKWSDVDWLTGRLLVERGIVGQQVNDVKTPESRKKLVIDRELLTALQTWKQSAQFSGPEDWMFASPVQHGRLPWSYDQVWRVYQRSAKAAGIGGLGTHSLRHTYRTWLDSVGTPIGVQQKLMRHADIRTTMNIYGDAVTADMAEAHRKIVGLALNGSQMDRKPS
jgi:integrase